MAQFIVPPGGFAGFSQQTAAARAALSGGRTRGTGTRRRRRSRSQSRRAKSSSRRARSGGGGRKRKLKFGSPAWQRKYKVGKFRKKRR